jgi:2-methylisocitrate lyase-like PEP mutase family enzyme
MSQLDKALSFKNLHQGPQPLVMPNPWDAGTARVLASMGFKALATTSAGLAFAFGRKDAENALSRDEILRNAHDIVNASDLPVSADLENGFGDTPDAVAETIRMAVAIGLVGGSIEDATGRQESPIYAFDHAVERIAAAAEVVRGLPFPFMLTARAENFLNGRFDLDDTIRRLQAFEAAGADVLFAPGLPDAEAIRLVCASVSKPVSVVMGLKGTTYSVSQLGDLGVRRISLGSSLSRAAWGAFMRAAQEVQSMGTFSFSDQAIPSDVVNGMMIKD